MWLTRLNGILAAPAEMLSLTPASPARFRGRYLRYGDTLFALGQLIAQGAEAVVYELIDVNRAVRGPVIKICRYPPGSREYREWAVPYRMERNSVSARPDIEMMPAVLHEVPGGFVKLQDYVSLDPWMDWTMPESASPITDILESQGPDAALRCAAELVRKHGPQGNFLERQGVILSRLNRWDEAREVLEAAFKAYATTSRAGVLRTGLLLAKAQAAIYQKNPLAGASDVLRMKLPDGSTMTQAVFLDSQASARDDSLEDRAMYVLFEVLNLEPRFIPALVMVAEELVRTPYASRTAIDILDAIERIDPGREDVREFRAGIEGEAVTAPEGAAALAGSLQQPEPPQEIPANVQTRMKAFDAAYRPEPTEAQLAEARLEAVWANEAAGRVEDAEAAASAAVNLDPSNVLYPLVLASLLERRGRDVEARALLENTTGLFPDRPDAFLALGEILLKVEDWQEAELAFLRASRLTSGARWRVDLGLGMAYRKLGERDKALVCLRRALAEAPDHRESATGTRHQTWKGFAATQLAYALRDESLGASDDGAEEAVRVLEEVLQTHSDEPELLFCHAQGLTMVGRLEEAVTALDRAASMEPSHPNAAEFAKMLRDHLRGEVIAQ